MRDLGLPPLPALTSPMVSPTQSLDGRILSRKIFIGKVQKKFRKSKSPQKKVVNTYYPS